MTSMDTLTQGVYGVAKGGIHGQYMDGRGVICMRWSL